MKGKDREDEDEVELREPRHKNIRDERDGSEDNNHYEHNHYIVEDEEYNVSTDEHTEDNTEAGNNIHNEDPEEEENDYENEENEKDEDAAEESPNEAKKADNMDITPRIPPPRFDFSLSHNHSNNQSNNNHSDNYNQVYVLRSRRNNTKSPRWFNYFFS
jgi:hypothetical protein